MHVDIVKFVKKYNVSSSMVNEDQLIFILKNLQIILEKNIEGDIVEFGCNIGTTTIFISRLLKLYKSDKVVHVYDSWKGLPEKNTFDLPNNKYVKGCFKVSKSNFIDNLIRNNVSIPNVHSGWFNDLSNKDIPSKISFAIFDSYFYCSILESFNKTYKYISSLGIIIVNKYNDSSLPGVKSACDLFLNNKNEYNQLNENYDQNCKMTKIIKK